MQKYKKIYGKKKYIFRKKKYIEKKKKKKIFFLQFLISSDFIFPSGNLKNMNYLRLTENDQQKQIYKEIHKQKDKKIEK